MEKYSAEDILNDDNSPLIDNYRENSYRRSYLSRADKTCLSIFLSCGVFLICWQPDSYRPMPNAKNHSDSKRLSNYIENDGSTIEIKYMSYDDVRGRPYNVTYDPRSFIIDGKRTLLLGGSIHYPRSTPGMWDNLLMKAKDDGLNHIQLNIFWNFHEYKRHQYDFSGRRDLELLYRKAMRHGLFLSVRLGPFVDAEWNSGGLPIWLRSIPNMVPRSNNQPWKTEMERFVRMIFKLSGPYLAKNGGPIILTEIESDYNGKDIEYAEWCQNLVESMDLGIPSFTRFSKTTENTISSCNENDCVDFAYAHVKERTSEPLAWTPNKGSQQSWDQRTKTTENTRRPEEVAYTLAQWFAIGGSHYSHNMYHGGNNYGKWTGATATNMYSDDASLHFDGLSNEPKKSHLQKLHQVLIANHWALLSDYVQLNNCQHLPWYNASAATFERGYQQRAFIYASQSNLSITFLENLDSSPALTRFQGREHELPARSISIVDSSGMLLYSTASVMVSGLKSKRIYKTLVDESILEWREWPEPLQGGQTVRYITNEVPLEQLVVTQDISEYLVYNTTITTTSFEKIPLTWTTASANAYAIFVDGKFVADVYCHRRNQTSSVLKAYLGPLPPGKHDLVMISSSLGIGSQNVKGITGKIWLGADDITFKKWTMRPGLYGEQLLIHEAKWVDTVAWTYVVNQTTTQRPMTWFQTTFPGHLIPQLPETSILIDCLGLNRGHLHLNGRHLGRYWMIGNNDTYIQRYYHIPRDWIENENVLTIFEESKMKSLQNVKIVLSQMVEKTQSGIRSSTFLSTQE